MTLRMVPTLDREGPNVVDTQGSFVSMSPSQLRSVGFTDDASSLPDDLAREPFIWNIEREAMIWQLLGSYHTNSYSQPKDFLMTNTTHLASTLDDKKTEFLRLRSGNKFHTVQGEQTQSLNKFKENHATLVSCKEDLISVLDAPPKAEAHGVERTSAQPHPFDDEDNETPIIFGRGSIPEAAAAKPLPLGDDDEDSEEDDDEDSEEENDVVETPIAFKGNLHAAAVKPIPFDDDDEDTEEEDTEDVDNQNDFALAGAVKSMAIDGTIASESISLEDCLDQCVMNRSPEFVSNVRRLLGLYRNSAVHIRDIPKEELEELKDDVRMNFNQLSGDRAQLQKKSRKLASFIENADGHKKGCVMRLIVDGIVAQADDQVAPLENAAFWYAAVAVDLARSSSDFLDLLVGCFFNTTIFTVPCLPPASVPGRNELMGMRPGEALDQYIVRICGIMGIFFAVMETKAPEGPVNPYGIEQAKQWLEDLLDACERIDDIPLIIPAILHTYWKFVGDEMWNTNPLEVTEKLLERSRRVAERVPSQPGTAGPIRLLQQMDDQFKLDPFLPKHPGCQNYLGRVEETNSQNSHQREHHHHHHHDHRDSRDGGNSSSSRNRGGGYR